MLLIYPPVAKPSEPPAGLAKLFGTLKRHGIPCRLLDANIEGILSLLSQPLESSDTWTTRALRHRAAHLQELRDPGGYKSPDRYRRAVLDLNRILVKATCDMGVRASLVNYVDQELSPLRSRDLLRAAEQPERNPFSGYFMKRLDQIVAEGDHRTIGFSLNYLSQALCTFAMAGFIKREYPSLKVILGGGLVTSWMNRPNWKNPFTGLIDAMAAGPGEEWLISYLGHVYKPGEDAPDFESLPENRYFAPGFILPFSTSSGCYWHRCCFCPETAEGNAYKPIRSSRALEQAEELAEKTGASLVHFVDNALSPAFLQEIARRGFSRPWYGFVRGSSLLADRDFAHALKRSGCMMLKLGVESGSQEVLDKLRKGIVLETLVHILKAMKSAGIGTYVYLLFGTPPEDLVKARRTMIFTAQYAEYIDFLNVAIFNMPVCSKEAEAYGTSPFYEGDLSLYTDFAHPFGWERSLVRSFLDKEFNRDPAISAILRREPALFTSNHAPFFLIHGQYEVRSIGTME